MKNQLPPSRSGVRLSRDDLSGAGWVFVRDLRTPSRVRVAKRRNHLAPQSDAARDRSEAVARATQAVLDLFEQEAVVFAGDLGFDPTDLAIGRVDIEHTDTPGNVTATGSACMYVRPASGEAEEEMESLSGLIGAYGDLRIRWEQHLVLRDIDRVVDGEDLARVFSGPHIRKLGPSTERELAELYLDETEFYRTNLAIVLDGSLIGAARVLQMHPSDIPVTPGATPNEPESNAVELCFCIDEAHLGQRLGSRVLSALASVCTEHDPSAIVLVQVPADDERLLAVAEDAGFVSHAVTGNGRLTLRFDKTID